ncbi:MAG TPA: hypothetical protein VN316_02520 [candidate division Zixibacteria bacterium]|nr:hypothetical protein [candidate division Zixibacteria bacterium]
MKLLFIIYSVGVIWNASPVFADTGRLPNPPFRIVLMWQVQKDVSIEDIELLRQKGVTVVQAFGILRWSNDSVRNYLDLMDRYNIKVVMSLDKLASRIGKEWTYDRDRAAHFIRKWKDHTGVFAWHLFDEPCNKDKNIPSSFQEKMYTYVKALDPSHPILLSFNGTRDEDYERCFSEKSFDILDLHAYMNDTLSSRQDNLITMFNKHSKSTYPIIITIRAFRYANVASPPPKDMLQRQYNLFFRKYAITPNVGFYGWKLNPNVGIIDDPGLMKQFSELQLLY